MLKTLSDMTRSHYVLSMQIQAELKTSVSKEKFSYLWWFLDPVIMMFIYYFVISVILGRGGPGYHLFVLSALISWQWFARSLNAATGAFNTSSGIIKHTPIPLFILLLSPALANMVYAFFGFLVVLAVVAEVPGYSVFFLPLIMFIQLIFSLALSCFTSVINVYLPDMKRIVGFGIRIWWFLSPILYEAERVLGSDRIPEIGKKLFLANPFATLIPAYREILIHHGMPDITGLLALLAFSIIFLELGLIVLRRFSNDIPKML